MLANKLASYLVTKSYLKKQKHDFHVLLFSPQYESQTLCRLQTSIADFNSLKIYTYCLRNTNFFCIFALLLEETEWKKAVRLIQMSLVSAFCITISKTCPRCIDKISACLLSPHRFCLLTRPASLWLRLHIHCEYTRRLKIHTDQTSLLMIQSMCFAVSFFW